MTPDLVMEWALAVAALSAATWLAVMVAGVAIAFVIDLVEDTREWLHRT